MQTQPVYNYLTWVKTSFGNNAYNSLASNLEFTRTLKLNDWQLYGSSRLGVYNADTTLTHITFTINGIDSNGNFEVNQIISQTNTTINNFDFKHHLAHKQFELTNHLGNVLATILDRKTNNTADVVTAQHYYPFGSVMSSYKEEELVGLIETKKIDLFTPSEINNFGSWNSTYEPTIGKCLEIGILGAEMLTVAENVGWRKTLGTLTEDDMKDKHVWHLGANLPSQGYGTKVPIAVNNEVSAIMNNAGNTNGKYAVYLAGPVNARHTLIVTYNSDDVRLSVYDQGTGWDKKFALPYNVQMQFNEMNSIFTNWNQNKVESKLWRLNKLEKTELIKPR